MTLRRLEPIAFALAALLVAAASVQLAYLTEPYVPLLVLASAGALALIVFRPIVGVYLGLLLAPLEHLSLAVGSQGTTPGSAGFALSPAEVMLIVAGGAWVVRRVVRGQFPVIDSPLTKPCLLVLLAIVPGLAVAEDKLPVAKVLVIWTALFLVYQLVVDQGDAATVRRLLLALGVAGGVLGGIALVSSGGGSELALVGAEAAEGRVEGSFGSANTFATFEAVALPGALALALLSRGPVRIVAATSFVLTAAGLLLSLSRGGMLAAAGALVIMVAWAPFRRLAAVVAVAAIVVVSVTGSSLLGDVRLADTVSGRISSFEYATEANPRLAIWETAPQMIADHPLFGIGANAFPVVSPRYGVFSPDAEGGVYLHAHNIPLTVAIELGLLGLAGLAWLVVALVRVLVDAYRRANEVGRGLTMSVGAALFALALHGMVDYTLRLNVMVAAVLVLAGCAVILSRTSAASAGEHQGRGRPAGSPPWRPSRSERRAAVPSGNRPT